MVTLPRSGWREHPGLLAVVDALGGPRAARLVGGAVRDGLMALPVSDIDVATSLLPDAVTAALEAAGIKVVPTGLAHGTVTAVSSGLVVEVTTLRRDVATDGRRATVAFTDNWRDDAARRDFTINALYADVSTGEVFDWFGGLDDLSARKVRFIGDPLTRIAEDHLRILRFFRFHARFGRGEADAAGLLACSTRANDLMALSRERIASELLKLLATENPTPVVAMMIENGIFKPILPEITDASPLARCVERERAFGVPGDAGRRLAALVDHRQAFAAALGGRLKLSTALSKRIVAASDATTDKLEAFAYRLGLESAVDRLILGEGQLADFDRIKHWKRPIFPISGGALIARGLLPGPVVARTLLRIEQQWIERQFPVGERFEAIVSEELSRAI